MFITVLILSMVLLLTIWFLCWYLELQNGLVHRAARATKSLERSKARSSFLDEILPALTRARNTLQSEFVQLTGERAEFEHRLATARSFKEGSKQGPADQRTFEREQYKHALEMLRLQNNLISETDRGALRPLRLEAQRARLRVEADERVVESILTQQAIEEARGRKHGLGTKPSQTATLSAALGTLIEQYKADGRETAELDLALNALIAVGEAKHE